MTHKYERIYDVPGKNEDRADWAEEAFESFRRRVMPNEDDRIAMIDFLADLFHLADRLGLQQDEVIEEAQTSYRADITPGEIGSAEPVKVRI
jgi:hypothetical protein